MFVFIGKISSILIDERTRLQKEIDECAGLESEIGEKNKNVAKTKEQTHKVKRKNEVLSKKKK